jgi:putative aminopeptidase FrvX
MTILRELSEAVGVSGQEGPVRSIILDAIREHVDQIEVDTIGNLMALKRGTGPDPVRAMIAAHMDEIGLMVIGYDSNGFLRVGQVGGIDARLLPGKVLQLGPDALPGVIGLKPVHLLDDGEEEKVTKLENLVIDIGAKSKGEAEGLVPLGTCATFPTKFREFGPTVSGKAFDDRAGCAVLVELLRGEPFPCDVHAVFTVQEEVGRRGARVSAHKIAPDCGFALEGTICDDIPKDKDESPTTTMGGGPAISVMDRSFIADKRLLDLLTSTAEALSIPYQFKRPGIGGTDAGAMVRSREGVPSVGVAVPSRYIHSPVALLSLEDFNNTVRLMRESLARLTPSILSRD